MRTIEVRFHTVAQMQPGANPSGEPQTKFVQQVKVDRHIQAQAATALEAAIPALLGNPLWAVVKRAATSESADEQEIQGALSTVIGRLIRDGADLSTVGVFAL